MRVDLFDFDLPQERIALRPARPRDSARLLLVEGGGHLRPSGARPAGICCGRGDVLVFNDTKVIPAQLEGRRGEAQHRRDAAQARRPARMAGVPAQRQAGARSATRSISAQGVAASVVEKATDGSALLHFHGDEPVELLLERAGRMPLPPYIASKRPAETEDRADYQTMFAREEGAVAAPTAALHFTPRLLEALDARGIGRETLTLHVGAGTFLPVKADDTGGHQMHAEWGRIDAATAERLNAARASGGRLIAVGTTSLRLLESAAGDDGIIRPFEGDTAIFITPGYRFKAIDGLITNFHLPRSTLFMLVSALMGLDVMKAAYAHAIERGTGSTVARCCGRSHSRRARRI